MRLSELAMLAGGCAIFTSTACAQAWHFQAGAAIEETLTDNVNLAPSDRAKSDLVTQLTPTLSVSERTARTNLSGVIRAPILLYLRTGGENNQVLPDGIINGRVEAVEKFFYVEGAASTQQSYFTPFGAQPVSLANATPNRYRADWYSVSPYIQSAASKDIRYELRDDNIWTHQSGAPSVTNDSYTNHLIGRILRDPSPVGWALEIDRTADRFGDQQKLVTQLVRARVPVQVDPVLRVSASGGYEDNRYTLSNPHGAIYGFGADWRPGPRTTVKGEWEHRFFGASYRFNFDTRTPLSTWSASASRGLTSYPQQLATLKPGGDVAATLNQLLLSRIPDPTERQLAVNQIISDAGLPASLANPITLYAQQLYLEEREQVTAGILGARNRLLLSVYRARSEPISGAGVPLPPLLASLNNNTQRGVNVIWDHPLTPVSAFNVNAAIIKTTGNAGFEGSTMQRSIIAEFLSRLSPSLTAHVGMRYQLLHSDITDSYREAAVFAGLSYVCCGAATRAATGTPSSSQSLSYGR